MKTRANKEQKTVSQTMSTTTSKSNKTRPGKQSKTTDNKLSNIIANSPLLTTQRKLLETIDSSPRLLKTFSHLSAQPGSPVQCATDDKELLQVKFLPLQRQTKPEEEELQAKFKPTQMKQDTKYKPNQTGLPDSLKTGIETLSGISMDNVRVHYNSSKPAQLNALAYAQGTDIHVSPGKQQHLPHEAWHVVQQAQGRVKPTMQMKDGVAINDDTGLENEANVMGARAASIGVVQEKSTESAPVYSQLLGEVQRFTSPSGMVLQGLFSLVAVGRQEKTRGGVRAGYDAATNTADLHINAGANANGEMMQDFLMTLWEVRDTISSRQSAGGPPGHVEMHPGGSQVLKMTMEMLGEAVGNNPELQNARNAKGNRQQAGHALGVGIPPDQINDVLDSTVVPEHILYRNSLVGVAGVTMNPVGRGTSGGTVNMLQANPVGGAERALYDAALNALTPFMSINVTITLPILTNIIDRLENGVSLLNRLALWAKYKIEQLR